VVFAKQPLAFRAYLGKHHQTPTVSLKGKNAEGMEN